MLISRGIDHGIIWGQDNSFTGNWIIYDNRVLGISITIRRRSRLFLHSLNIGVESGLARHLRGGTLDRRLGSTEEISAGQRTTVGQAHALRIETDRDLSVAWNASVPVSWRERDKVEPIAGVHNADITGPAFKLIVRRQKGNLPVLNGNSHRITNDEIAADTTSPPQGSSHVKQKTAVMSIGTTGSVHHHTRKIWRRHIHIHRHFHVRVRRRRIRCPHTCIH